MHGSRAFRSSQPEIPPMPGPEQVGFDDLNAALKAAGEETRLRILGLLFEAELTVSDLTEILRQSQPRISRHLKLLAEAGLVARFREGAWAFFRLAAPVPAGAAHPRGPGDRARRRAPRRGPCRARGGRAGLFQGACGRVGPHPPAARGGRGRGGGNPRRALRPAVPLAARSRHRYRPHARAARAADRARARHRLLARHAGAGARPARPRGLEALQRAPGRHLRSAAAARFLRRRHHPSGAALPRRRRARDPRGGARAAAAGPARGGRFRAARSRIPARGARPSAPRLRGRDRDAMDGGGRTRRHRPSRPRARRGRQDRGVAVAGARPARAARRLRARGRVMNQETPARRSRFIEGGRDIRVSFAFFPPKTDEMEKTLWESVERLGPLRPAFVSVTYGAGGSTRERTHATVKRILAETALTPAAHLTCVAATRQDIDAVIASYMAAGVSHIVALRGDPLGGVGERYAPHPGGYLNAADLVGGI